MPAIDLLALIVRDAAGAGGRDESTSNCLEALAYFDPHRGGGHVERRAVLEQLLLSVVAVCDVVLMEVELFR
ncbi:hypothetical protein [Rathayibacter rathayi]|uniref:hypothetical protein n=1 Tax=Rathayibacter rathayi TaxID=33887 RepID=UPI0011B0E52A|nr:hypothetical protein [Rathayibacter rathayi]